MCEFRARTAPRRDFRALRYILRSSIILSPCCLARASTKLAGHIFPTLSTTQNSACFVLRSATRLRSSQPVPRRDRSSLPLRFRDPSPSLPSAATSGLLLPFPENRTEKYAA